MFGSMLKRIVVGGVCAVILLCMCVAFSACGENIKRRVRFYVVYSTATAAAVRGLGGAACDFNYDGKIYTAAACFQFIGDAQNYAEGMGRRGVSCGVLTCERLSFRLTTYSASSHAARYEHIIDSLNTTCVTVGEVALSLEGGGDKTAARAELSVVTQNFANLLDGSSDCFTAPLARLCYLAADCAYSDLLFVWEVRRLQLAVADILFNIRLS